MFSKLKSRFSRLWLSKERSRPGTPARVEFYTRAGCCLCDEAYELIEHARRNYSFDLQIIDVDQSAELRDKFGTKVPVLLVNGRERFHGRINEALLERLLSMETTQG